MTGLLIFMQLTTLVVPTRTGATHASVIWTDSAGVARSEVISGIPFDRFPPKPVAFVGTVRQWETLWTSGNAFGKPRVVGGKATVSGPTGELERGSVEVVRAGVLKVYLDNANVAPAVVIRNYTGTPPNITIPAPRCGAQITSGTLSGSPDRACAAASEK